MNYSEKSSRHRRWHTRLLAIVSLSTVAATILTPLATREALSRERHLERWEETFAIAKLTRIDPLAKQVQKEDLQELAEQKQLEAEAVQLQREQKQQHLEQKQLILERYQQVAESKQRYADANGRREDARLHYQEAQKYRSQAQSLREKAAQKHLRAMESLSEAKAWHRKVTVFKSEAERWHLLAEICSDSSARHRKCHAEARRHEAEVYLHRFESEKKRAISKQNYSDVNRWDSYISYWSGETKRWESEERWQQLIVIFTSPAVLTAISFIAIVICVVFLSLSKGNRLLNLARFPSFLSRFLSRTLKEDLFSDLLTLCDQLGNSKSPPWLITFRFILAVIGMLYANWKIVVEEDRNASTQAISSVLPPPSKDLTAGDDDEN